MKQKFKIVNKKYQANVLEIGLTAKIYTCQNDHFTVYFSHSSYFALYIYIILIGIEYDTRKYCMS